MNQSLLRRNPAACQTERRLVCTMRATRSLNGRGKRIHRRTGVQVEKLHLRERQRVNYRLSREGDRTHAMQQVPAALVGRTGGQPPLPRLRAQGRRVCPVSCRP